MCYQQHLKISKKSATCKKYASLEMYIWCRVLLQLGSAIHNRLFKLAHGDNNCFHMMVFCSIVGTTVPKWSVAGTPQTLFFVHQPKAISQHQSQPNLPANLACNLASTFTNHPRPSKIPSNFFKRRTPLVFQAVCCTK